MNYICNIYSHGLVDLIQKTCFNSVNVHCRISIHGRESSTDYESTQMKKIKYQSTLWLCRRGSRGFQEWAAKRSARGSKGYPCLRQKSWCSLDAPRSAWGSPVSLFFISASVTWCGSANVTFKRPDLAATSVAYDRVTMKLWGVISSVLQRRANIQLG